jgi:hypothetical protein
VNQIIYQLSEARQQRLTERLDKFNFPDDLSQPVLRASKVHYEVAGRAVGTAYGGIGLIHQLTRELDLAREIDRRVQLFKIHLPYHESDHVLNLAYNALCGGQCLEDLELRRQDEAYLNALGATRIPDPTTAGDFCRRFDRHQLGQLQAAFDAARRKVWARQPKSFFAEARIEADGTLVETGGECKQGIDLSYKGVWGYHPLVLTLANTGEVLRIQNRSGNRPSHEGAAALFDECIALCRAADFAKIVLRGDTDFSQTACLDGWHDQGDVRFIFGYDCTARLHILADDLPATAWKPLQRSPKYTTKTAAQRQRPARVKQQVVEQRGFKDIRLVDEWVAEMPYRPHACQQTYRLIVVLKNLAVNDPAQGRLFDDYRYFFYITNYDAQECTPAEIVFSANDRCQQENLLAQLNSARALYAPVDNLLANEAYMLMTSLAWNLKAWLALRVPLASGPGHQARQREQQTLLKLEFRTFVNYWMRVPCQVLRTGGRLVLRLLAWNRWQRMFLELTEQLSRPLRC